MKITFNIFNPSFPSSVLRFMLFFLIFVIVFIIQSCDYLSSNSSINQSNSTIIDTIIIHDTLFISETKQLQIIIPDLVKVDSFYKELNGSKMIDGITAFVHGKETKSRWAVEGYPHFAVFCFNKLVSINKIRFNLYKGDQGYTNYIKLYNFSDLLWEGDIGDSLWNNINLNFYGSMIYLEVSGPSKRIVGKTNSWTDIGEIEFYGP